MRSRALLILVSAQVVGFAGQGCKEDQDAHSKPTRVEKKTLPKIRITRDQELVFTFRSGKAWKTVNRLDEVPLGARGWVRVQDPSRPLPPSDLVYVADLRQANKKGDFPYRIMKREAFLKGRPLPGPGGPMIKGTQPGIGQVTLYTRPGCAACDAARRYLKQRGVAFQEKNVATDPAAAGELARKAARKGLPGNAVPAFDLGGELVVGLDVKQLERLLRRRI